MLFHTSSRAIRSQLLEFWYLRIGEAKNPGPDEAQPGLLLGCFNPTGLLNKGDLLKYLPSGSQALWGVSESHLSPLGIRKFTKDLSFHDSKLQLLHGSPVPYRSRAVSAIGGKQLGVGFLTNVPAKPLHPSWTLEAWSQSRFHVCTFFIQHKWIHGGVFYGPAFKADTTEVKKKTDDMLKILTDRLVLGMKGMRFIMGDFNQKDGSLQQTEIWRKLGWQEVQTLGYHLKGRLISNTCKSKTVKDFIWISPEMVPYFQQVETQDDLFADHSVLFAKFSQWGPQEKIPLWRKPKPIDWGKVTLPLPELSLEEHAVSSIGQGVNNEEVIQQIAKEFEERTSRAQTNKTGHGLLNQQRGRSRTKEPFEVEEYTRPITKSRAGDRQPNHFGISLQYTRWFRQLRRLESFKRQQTNFEFLNLSQKIQQDRVWRKILSAPGFAQGFRQWWSNQSWHRANIPDSLPISTPSHNLACLICIGFEEKVQVLEETLNQELLSRAKQNRVANPNKVFDDLRKPSANLVQLLDDSISTTVTAIDHEKQTIEVHPAVDFDPHTPLCCTHSQCKVLEIEGNCITVDSTSDLTIGQDVKQEKFEASLGKLFAKLGEEWTKRWDKHLYVDDSKWDPIISFFRQSMTAIPSMKLEPITVEQWIRTIRGKKAKAATGPDGWARKDLLNMPADLVQQLLHMLHSIEKGQAWPTSVVTGIVHSLEKVTNATKTTQFRPITIFSLIYRTWSTIRSKQCLQHLIDHVPSRCYGNLPGRHAGQVWWGIQQSIEDSNYNGRHLTGAMIDIVKCFNALPRCPLLAVCQHLGIHDDIIRAWSSGLTQMIRRFSIRGGVGPPIKSTTGFAEGCGMSVVAMVASNVLTSQWLLHKVPKCDLWTYVDNIELTSPDAPTTLEALENFTKFTELLDLEVDADKTFVWATKGIDRGWFRKNDQTVKTWARDLGGHVQYSLQTTNSVVVSKITKFKPRWKDMCRSRATYAQKIRSLKTLAWPNALHGISSVHLSEDHLDNLRSGAMTGLNQQSKGASPKIQLSLIEKPLADPGFHAIWQTIVDFRHHTTFDASVAIMDKLTTETFSRIRPTTGPCSVLLTRLHQINWSWRNSTVRDHWDQAIDLWEVCIQELYLRLSMAWQQRILGDISHRKTYQKAFVNCNPQITMEGLPTDPQEASVLRKCLNGTFFTEDRRKHQLGEECTNCPLCNKKDSQKHRHWECDSLHTARSECPPEVLEKILNQPSYVTDHGWIPNPPSLSKFHSMLLQIPDKSNEFFKVETPSFVELFTDGSCIDSSDPITRLAGWGVAVGTPQNQHHEYAPVAAGLVPGLIQTISRAELTATLAALKFGLEQGKPFRIWSDSSYVINQIHKNYHKSADHPVTNKIPNHDLIDKIRVCQHAARSIFSGIHKVVSHQQQALLDPDELWICKGNEAADTIASNSYTEYPKLLETQNCLTRELSELRNIRFWVHKVLIRTGQLAMDKIRERKRQEDDDEIQPIIPPKQLESYQPWTFPTVLPEVFHKYNIPEWSTVAEWVRSLHDGTEQMYLSWYQLYADFHLKWPTYGPWYKSSSKRWFGGATRPTCGFAKGSRWMSDFLTRLGRQIGTPVPSRLQRPDSHVVCFWTYCLPVSISTDRFNDIERWLQTKRPRFRQPRDFEFDED